MPGNKPSPTSLSRQTISRQLRAMIEARDLSASALGREAGVDPGVISRFLLGERDIRLETLDRLADVLGLRLIEGARPTTRPKRATSSKRSPRAAQVDPVAGDSNGSNREQES